MNIVCEEKVIAIYTHVDIKSASKAKKISKKGYASYVIFIILLIMVIALLVTTPNIVDIYINNSSADSVIIKDKAFADEENIINENSDKQVSAGHDSFTIKEIRDVPVISQFPELPSGCEITTATMLLQWAGINIDKQDVAKAIPKGPLPAIRNGSLQGGNPNRVFVGNPFAKSGFGVYHKPIAELINIYLRDIQRTLLVFHLKIY